MKIAIYETTLRDGMQGEGMFPSVQDKLVVTKLLDDLGVEVRTGLWRTMRPVINYEKCSGCWWVCSTYCPDGAINVRDDGKPDIDYDHCKGCLVCVAQCPPHAIESIPEYLAKEQETAEEKS